MRTNIVIDDKLMSQVLKLTRYKTKREAVEAGLKLLVKMVRQQRIRAVRGKLRWVGDLEAMRRDT
jgi:Arc/MetJ family transcription regulator